MRDDILLDYANFESSLVRMQLLLNSNELERNRYASEKVRIQATAQDVKNNTAELRARLEEAQKQLALRKEYDQLAEKILSNRLLKPREDQLANIEKLNNEIAELERESRDYAATWSERREQFGKIVEEGMQLRRLIRDEKEEVERREGMEGRDEQDDADGVSTRGRSAVNTPRPEAGGATPLHPGSEGDPNNSLAPDRYSTRGKSPFRVSTPIPEEGTPRPGGTDVDESMEEGQASVQEVVSSPSEGLVAEEEEEGEMEDGRSVSGDDRRGDDSMDTS
jgi:Tho complex subunit 7